MKKPKLGQNFLTDEDAIRRIAQSLGDTTTRTVIEIGPGHGAITDLLAGAGQQAENRCARLHCIEFDPALARELTFRFRNDDHITIHHADILQTDLAGLVHEKEMSSRPEASPFDAAVERSAAASALASALLPLLGKPRL